MGQHIWGISSLISLSLVYNIFLCECVLCYFFSEFYKPTNRHTCTRVYKQYSSDSQKGITNKHKKTGKWEIK